MHMLTAHPEDGHNINVESAEPFLKHVAASAQTGTKTENDSQTYRYYVMKIILLVQRTLVLPQK